MIVSDGDRVLQIISNLLSNAFRWTPDGGRIDLALQTANGTVTVDVADSGPGIAADERERIFRPFWSDGRRAAPGSGLPIARELAVALGGRIELRDRGRARGAASGSSCRTAASSRALERCFGGARRRRASTACSTRSSRSLTPRQPDETRSTSRARSSMRAWRSARMSPSSRSSRRITWFSSPRISARLRADRDDLGAEAVVHRGADLLGQRALELGGGCGERLDLDARALERGFELGRRDPPGRGFRDPRFRPFECLLVHGAGGYAGRRMDTSELDYDLPSELIAQHPAERRDASRLLVYDRASGAVRHRTFAELPDELSGELAVVNDTRVVPARIRIEQPKGEVLLLEHEGDGEWLALARPTRRLQGGRPATGRSSCSSTSARAAGGVRLDGEPDGEAPLPPYITEPLADPAPLPDGLRGRGRLGRRSDGRAPLHAGAARRGSTSSASRSTSASTRSARSRRSTLEAHELHGERYAVRPEAWERIEAAERVLAVGTTTVRVLETVAQATACCRAGRRLFVTPGFEFRRVDALLTNFHLPRSTLLALVMAFAGIEETRRLYRLAVEERYRFYSFGDAMLIL